MEIVEAINPRDNVKEFIEEKLKKAVKEVTPYKKQLVQNYKITSSLQPIYEYGTILDIDSAQDLGSSVCSSVSLVFDIILPLHFVDYDNFHRPGYLQCLFLSKVLFLFIQNFPKLRSY